jgi:hypothetical protein
MASNARLRLTALIAGALISVASSASASTWSLSSTGTQSKARASVGPAAPTPASSCASANTAKLTWTAITHAASYGVLQATSSTGPFTVVAAAVTGTTWTSGTLASGSAYYWRMTSKVSTNWVSAQSASTAGRTISSSSCS